MLAILGLALLGGLVAAYGSLRGLPRSNEDMVFY